MKDILIKIEHISFMAGVSIWSHFSHSEYCVQCSLLSARILLCARLSTVWMNIVYRALRCLLFAWVLLCAGLSAVWMNIIVNRALLSTWILCAGRWARTWTWTLACQFFVPISDLTWNSCWDSIRAYTWDFDSIEISVKCEDAYLILYLCNLNI